MSSTDPRAPVASTIILVEDDVRLSELVSHYLENNGFRVSVSHRGNEAVERVSRERPDLVILDLGLPGQDGLSICKQLRPMYVNPILILTARDNDIDHVLGLEMGADDYVIKPVEPRVLMARINALLRRSRPIPQVMIQPLIFGALHINSSARSVTLNGKQMGLSTGEFELLAYLAEHAGEIQSREKLFRNLYRRDYDGSDRMLDVRISHLRKKLGDDDRSERIKTIWGQGYLFVPDAW